MTDEELNELEALAEVRRARKQIAEFQYWRNFWRNHAETHERMWRETAALRQAEGQEAIAALTAATARAEAAEAKLATVPVGDLLEYVKHAAIVSEPYDEQEEQRFEELARRVEAWAVGEVQP